MKLFYGLPFLLSLFLVGCPLSGGDGSGGGGGGTGVFGTGTPPGDTGDTVESLNQNPLSGICSDLNGTIYVSSDDGKPLVSTEGVTYSVIEGESLNLNGVHCDRQSTSDLSIIFVGDGGTVLEYDGSTLTSQTSGTSANLNGVFGFDKDTIYAVGDAGVIRFFNGTDWSTVFVTNTSQSLYDVGGSNRTNVYAVGKSGTLTKLSGGSWIQIATNKLPAGFDPTTDLYAIWGVPGNLNEVFVVGEGGTILHLTGTVWQLEDSGTIKDLMGIHGTSNSNVIAVGKDGTILEYNGSSWSKTTLEEMPLFLDVLVTSASEAFAIGNLESEEDTDGVIFQGVSSAWAQIY